MKALVTGANGFIGSHLVEGLVERNYEVYCLVRKTSDLKWIKNLPVKFVYGNINDYSSLIGAVKDKEIVFHLAGLTKAYNVEDYYRVNAEGSKNILQACKEAGNNIKKIVYSSSLAVTGPATDFNPLTEESQCNPISDYGKSKYEGEKYAIEFMKELPNVDVDAIKNVDSLAILTKFKLPDSVKNEIKKIFSKKLNKDIKITEKIVEKVLGGIVLSFGTLVLDGNFATKITEVAEELKKSMGVK